MQKIQCPNCPGTFDTPFCAECGRPRTLKRIDGQYILNEISSVLNFDKGILYTIRELLIRPDVNIRAFIHQDRNRLVKPIIFIIVCSLIYILTEQVFGYEKAYVEALNSEENTTLLLLRWMQQNYGYANILMAIFIALWLKLLFRKHDYNIYEVLILLLFVIGIGMLFFTLFGVFEVVVGIRVMHYGALIGILYASWAIARFYDKTKWSSYLKAFAAYSLGMVCFYAIVILLGNVIDLVLK